MQGQVSFTQDLKGYDMTMTDWVIELEDQWYEKANYWSGSCEHFGQFKHEMARFRDMMKHFTDEEYDEILTDAWQEKWSKYQ